MISSFVRTFDNGAFQPSFRSGNVLVQAAAGESLDTDKLSKDGQVPKSGGLNCSQCGKLTKDSKALDNHIRNVHPDADDKGHFCPKCNASLKNKRSLKKH